MNYKEKQLQIPFNMESLIFTLPQMSYFNRPVIGKYPSYSISLEQVFLRIKGSFFAKMTRNVLFMPNEFQKRRIVSRYLHGVTFAGVFSKKDDNCLITPSGLLAVTFRQLNDPESMKLMFINDPVVETAMVYRTPDHMGLTWVICYQYKASTYEKVVKSLERHVLDYYGLKIDPKKLNLAQYSFLCYDPNAFLNPKYKNSNHGI